MFAATPPLEALKIILTKAMFRDESGVTSRKVMVDDVKRAYFYAPATRPIYMELPREDYSAEDEREDNIAKLDMSMYGTRDAAQNWQRTVAGHLISIGFRQGVANPCIFHNATKDVTTIVHGDDYVSTGTGKSMPGPNGHM